MNQHQNTTHTHTHKQIHVAYLIFMQTILAFYLIRIKSIQLLLKKSAKTLHL